MAVASGADLFGKWAVGANPGDATYLYAEDGQATMHRRLHALVQQLGGMPDSARIQHPMLNPRLFKIPSFAGSAIAAFTLSAGLYALIFYLSLFMQKYLGYSALGAGLRFLPLSALAFGGAPIAGRFSDKIGPKWILVAGMAFLIADVVAMTRLAHATVASDWVLILPGLILTGIGNGLVNPPISAVAMGSVAPRFIGMASGINNIARQFGVAFGIATMGALLGNRYDRLITQDVHRFAQVPQNVKTNMIAGIQQAGPIAGSLGLKGASLQYTHSPIFPRIAAMARHAFLLGTRDVVWLGAIFLVVGLLASLFLIRQQDMER